MTPTEFINKYGIAFSSGDDGPTTVTGYHYQWVKPAHWNSLNLLMKAPTGTTHKPEDFWCSYYKHIARHHKNLDAFRDNYQGRCYYNTTGLEYKRNYRYKRRYLLKMARGSGKIRSFLRDLADVQVETLHQYAI